MTAPEVITFRPLRREDFGLVARWLEEPRVKRWWNHETTDAAMEEAFGACVDGTDAMEVCLALVDGRPFGVIQRYEIADDPEDREELAAIVEVPPGALSVDYLIGEPDLQGRGLGPRMIAAFIAEAWEQHPEATVVLVPVHRDNRGSWRALELAGLTRVAEGELEPDNPIDDRGHVIYAARRPTTSPRI